MINIPKGYKQTEVGVIPEDWEVFPLSERAQRITDGEHITPRRSASGYYLLSARNILNGRVELSDVDYVPEDEYRRIRQRCNPEFGDVLISCSGTVGRVATVPLGLECVMVRSAALIKPIPATLSGGFVQFFLQSTTGQKQIFASINQGAQANLFLNHIQALRIPLPPTKTEQEAIATALSDTDALIESLEQLIAKKRQIKQGTMQELLTGKRRLPGFSGKWEEKRLGDVAFFLKGRGLPKAELSPYGAEPCIHYGELFTQYPETISKTISRTDTFQGVFRSIANDVLMPTSDVTPRGLAKACCVTMDGVILGGDILVIRSDLSRINGSFLSYLIRHEDDKVLQLVTGSTVFHLYGSDMKKFSFVMPPLPEQTAIAEILSEMDAELDALDTKLGKARLVKQGMMQELLTGRIRLV